MKKALVATHNVWPHQVHVPCFLENRQTFFCFLSWFFFFSLWSNNYNDKHPPLRRPERQHTLTRL